MTTNAKVGTGAKLNYSSSASATSGYAVMAELLDITSPQSEYQMVDVTSHDTTGANEYIPSTLVEGGTLEVTVNYTSANAKAFNGMKGLRRAFSIKYPASARHRFKGIVKGWHLAAPVKDKMTAVASIQVVSLPTFSAVSTVA